MFKSERPIVLSIGGHDPCNGAGIGADVKTMESLRVLGLTVCSALTIQTDLGVRMIDWIDEEMVGGQLVALLDRYRVDSVKISMVNDLEAVAMHAELILHYNPNTHILWDPIISSSSGYPFIESMSQPIIHDILKRVDGIIPNYDEWMVLEELMGKSPASIARESHTNILIKGGHNSKNKGVDTLYTPTEQHEFKPFDILQGYEKHGSGCMFSTSLACYLANGLSWMEAAQSAKTYTYQRMASNKTLLAYYESNP